MKKNNLRLATLAATLLGALPLLAQDATPASIVFTNVRVFDGTGSALSAPQSVLVERNLITKIAAKVDAPAGATVINGGGRTLMPGLIDAHTHIMFATMSQPALLTSDIGFINIASTKTAKDMLMRGFTSIRDVGGPVFALKKGIDRDLIPGPRIWPSGAMISQSGGHGDFRLPTDLPAQPGQMTYAERTGATVVADDADTVRKRSRELLALGASQLKLVAGGGAGSEYDPLDVTQYTVPELRSAVEAAENWGTYVMVHAYTPRAVRQSIEAGVKCIEHGHLLDDASAKLMAEKGIWWCLQPLTDDRPTGFAEGSPKRLKQLAIYDGTDTAYKLAKKYQIKTAWGTDVLFNTEGLKAQSDLLVIMTRWYSPAEALKMATSDNAQLLALSGPRSPYPGKLGVVEEGALADLLLVDGDPLANYSLVGDPAKNFLVIMKDGKIYKNTVR